MNDYPNNLNYCQQSLDSCQSNLVYPSLLEYNTEVNIPNEAAFPGQSFLSMNSSLDSYNAKGFSNVEMVNYSCQLQNYLYANMNQDWIPYNMNNFSPTPIPEVSMSPVVLSNVKVESPVIIEKNPQVPHNICTEYNPIKEKKDRRPLIYKCDICNKAFDRKYVLKRHRGTHSENREYHCTPCKMSFYRKDIYDRHLTTKKCIRAHQVIHGPSYTGPSIVSKKMTRSNSFFYLNNSYPYAQPSYVTGPLPVYNILAVNRIDSGYSYF